MYQKSFGHNCDDASAGSLWVVEQYIEGETIRERLNTRIKFTTAEVVRFIDTMLSLAVLSEQKMLVHRDIKPDNIMIDSTGKFWLLDFGIARHLDLDSLTQSAQQFGLFTLGYASTEQFRNLKRDIDIRADLFSIGVVAHEMISGENYYRKDTNDPLAILKRMEKVSISPLLIEGDTQFQLSAFICMIGDFRRTRRPRTAQEAQAIFNNIKSTIQL